MRNRNGRLRYYDIVNMRDAGPLPVRAHGFDAASRHFAADAPPHRHNEIELVRARGSRVTLMFGGRPFVFGAGDAAVFWAVVPHFAWKCDPGAQLCWVHVPLRQFLAWKIDPAFTQMLLRGSIVRDPRPRSDAVFFEQLDRWNEYKRLGNPEALAIAGLEVEALFRDTAMRVMAAGGSEHRAQEPVAADLVETMLRYIAEHYQEPIAVSDVAGAAGVTAAYAMRRFRSAVGATLAATVNDHRLAHAQRLLLTTKSSVLDILLDAGFGSATQFYALFRRRNGCTPEAYRATG